jgi:MraZ protein
VPDEGTKDQGGTEGGAIALAEPRFWGTHEQKVDSKGRVILPARFRDPFRNGAFIAKAPGGCLGVWTPAEFEKRTVDMIEKGRQGNAARTVARSWAAGTFDLIPDGQGRIQVPVQLRAYAKLETDGDVILNGAINHVEIWNAAKWMEVDEQASHHFLSGDEALDDVGF